MDDAQSRGGETSKATRRLSVRGREAESRKAGASGGKEGSKNTARISAGGTPSTGRRTSIGRVTPVGQKRKVDSELEPLKKSKNMDESGAAPAASDPMAELKLMMINLGNRMDGVRSNIGEVRTDLGAEIRKGNEATLALKQRICLLYTSPSPRD